MQEIDCENFDANLPEIISKIHKCTFMSIDTEFTGLYAERKLKSSLFDKPEDRYQKLKTSASKFIISQFGLTLFTRDPTADNRIKFNAEIYQFYLKPSAFGSIDRIFSFQTSCLEFLNAHKFDFNRFLKYGVSYFNQDEEKIVRNEMKNELFLLHTERDIDYFQHLYSQVSSWLAQTSEEEENNNLSIEVNSEQLNTLQEYIILSQLRSMFKLIWCCITDGRLIVERVSSEERNRLESKFRQNDNQLIDKLLGFSSVFKEMVNSEKPLVGHNLLTDLILMHQQFYKQLPKSYNQFKRNIHGLFPEVYDTKHILLSTQTNEKYGFLRSLHSLTDLYSHFLSETSYRLPKVTTNDVAVVIKPHHSGFDSYACGFSFLRLAHIHASLNLTEMETHMVTWTELIAALKPFQNHVNLIRAASHYLTLDCSDPNPCRPPWLLVRSRTNKPLCILEVTEIFSNYGTVDVKTVNDRTAVATVSNILCARDIMRAFSDNQEIEIVLYDTFKHSRVVRTSLWAACFGFLSISVFCFYKLFKN